MGGEEATRFENLRTGTHEIPSAVVAELLVNQYGSQLASLNLRMCTCYGNLLRSGETKTLVQLLAGLLPQTKIEAYHGLVRLYARPAEIRLGASIRWDPLFGPIVVGPPGPWEPVLP
jgi:hypothetical protein